MSFKFEQINIPPITEAIMSLDDRFLAPGRIKKAESRLFAQVFAQESDGCIDKFASWYRLQNGVTPKNGQAVELLMQTREREWFLNADAQSREKWMKFVSGFSGRTYMNMGVTLSSHGEYAGWESRRAVVFDAFQKTQDPRSTEMDRKKSWQKLLQVKHRAQQGPSSREYQQKILDHHNR